MAQETQSELKFLERLHNQTLKKDSKIEQDELDGGKEHTAKVRNTIEGDKKDLDDGRACATDILNLGMEMPHSGSEIGTIIKEHSIGLRSIDEAENGDFCKESDTSDGRL